MSIVRFLRSGNRFRMKAPLLAILALASFASPASVLAEDRFLTLSNTPLGSREEPLVLRTFLPDPGLGRAVLSNHALGARARKYAPGKGDVEGFVDPTPGLPAAIAVNFGTDLSYCWDTVECRLLYAWRGGFLDMTNYWGDPAIGRRAGFQYLPGLVGELVYVTEGSHPLGLFDTYTEDLKPVYLGYRLVAGVPEFAYRLGEATVKVRIEPGDKPLEIVAHYSVEGAKAWGYFESGYDFKQEDAGEGSFRVRIQGKPVAASAAAEASYSTEAPNAEWGEALFTTLGCFACHSRDGTRGHGPSLAGIYGTSRPLAGTDPVVADEAYLAESIVNPAAKVVDTFPAGYMPPYPIEPKQVDSLVLFIKSLAKP